LRVYRDVWTTLTAAMMAIGCLAALVVGTVASVLGMFVSLAVLGVMIGLVQQRDDGPGARRKAVIAGVLASTALVAIGGLVGFLGPEVLWLVVAAALASPWVLGRCARLGRKLAAAPAPPTPLEAAEPTPAAADPASPALSGETGCEDPHLLDDRALCLAWRRSFIALEQCRSVAMRVRVVQLRELYLEELERRNPAGLSAWLESGARAAGDPSRYLTMAGSDKSGGQRGTDPPEHDESSDRDDHSAHGPDQADR
jgi:hypothetical protein